MSGVTHMGKRAAIKYSSRFSATLSKDAFTRWWLCGDCD